MDEKDEITKQLITFPELVRRNAEKYGERVVFQMKREGIFETFTYRKVYEMVRSIAAALMSIGVRKGERTGVIGENRPEWPTSYLSIVYAGGTIVPIDPQLKHKEIGHILKLSGTKVVFSSKKLLPVLLECRENTGLPETIILMGKSSSKEFVVMDDFIKKGQELLSKGSFVPEDSEKELDDLLAIIFTSGTTGKSKGVMLTQRNIMFDAIASSKVIRVIEGDNFMSVLPLHHTFEATAGFVLPFYMGVTITYARSLKSREIIEDIKDSQATLLLGVPLLFEKMLKGLRKGISEQKGIIKALVGTNLAIVRGLKKLFKVDVGHALFSSVRNKTGLGSLRLFVAGGAALPFWVSKGFKELGFNIIQGYGLTETSPVTNVNPLDKVKPTSIGPPIPGIEVRIADADKMGVGEIAVKGPIVMKGYYKDKEETNKVNRGGWFYTGDYGRTDNDNYFYVTGRKKSVIVSYAGKNIYPEEVEGELLTSDFIEEALVVGRINGATKREEVHAIIYPNWEELDKFTELKGIEQTGKWMEEFFTEEIGKHCKDLADYKRAKSFSIREEEFPKTTTRKIKRFLFQGDAIETDK